MRRGMPWSRFAGRRERVHSTRAATKMIGATPTLPRRSQRLGALKKCFGTFASRLMLWAPPRCSAAFGRRPPPARALAQSIWADPRIWAGRCATTIARIAATPECAAARDRAHPLVCFGHDVYGYGVALMQVDRAVRPRKGLGKKPDSQKKCFP